MNKTKQRIKKLQEKLDISDNSLIRLMEVLYQFNIKQRKLLDRERIKAELQATNQTLAEVGEVIDEWHKERWWCSDDETDAIKELKTKLGLVGK